MTEVTKHSTAQTKCGLSQCPAGNFVGQEFISATRNVVVPLDCSQPGSFVHGDSPGKNTGVTLVQ